VEVRLIGARLRVMDNSEVMKKLEQLREIAALYSGVDAAGFSGSSFAWVAARDGWRLSLCDNRVLICSRREDGWSVSVSSAERRGLYELAAKVTGGEAQRTAEAFALKTTPKAFINREAAWRSKPASDKQKELLRRLGFKTSEPCSMGVAANEITRLLRIS
jgi:hypothetical protein